MGICSRAITSEIGKKAMDEIIKHGPDLYNYGTKKINKKTKLKKIIQKNQKELFNW